DDAVDAGRREHQTDRAEQREQPRVEARGRERTREALVHRLYIEEWQLRIDLLECAPQGFRGRRGIAVGSDYDVKSPEPVPRVVGRLGHRQIELGPWGDARASRADVAGDAHDDLLVHTAGNALAAGDALTDRILPWKRARRQRLADDHDLLAAGAIS